MDQKTKVEQSDFIDHTLKYFRESNPLLLSQIINYRLNQPRKDERKYHNDMIKELARKFNIQKWQEYVDSDELYQMSLTGHLIRAIQLENGSASLQNLIQITEPYLHFLRKLNGKNFTGQTARTVKGCLSATVFKRNNEHSWSVDENKADEFIIQANRKLNQFFEKQKKNFPLFDTIKPELSRTKKKQKLESLNNDIEQYNEKQYQYSDIKNSDYQENIKIENSFQNYDLNQIIDPKKINIEWMLSISDKIFNSLKAIQSGNNIDDQFLGNLIAFNILKPQLERLPECHKFID